MTSVDIVPLESIGTICRAMCHVARRKPLDLLKLNSLDGRPGAEAATAIRPIVPTISRCIHIEMYSIYIYVYTYH